MRGLSVNKNKITNYMIITTTLLILLPAFQNCGGGRKMSFSQDTAELASMDSNNTTVQTSALATNTDEFTVRATNSTQNAPLDIVWVVDNSGSMSDTASLVRNNIEAFITSIDTSSDFRLLMIGAQGNTGAQIQIPAAFRSDSRIKQINYQVESTDGPQILLDHLLNTKPLIQSKNYHLDTFFRTTSKKVIIFVTDDESLISASTIQNTLDGINNWRNQYTIYGFVGLGGTASPCQASTGNTYINLAENTAGKYFNICSTNWTAHFNDLKNNIISKITTNNNFILAKDYVDKVSAVYINGIKQDASKYTVSKSGKKATLSFKDSSKIKTNDKIKIEYSYSKN